MSFILIADSGSTKTHWALVRNDGAVVEEWFGTGLNPYFLSSRELEEQIKNQTGNLLPSAFPEYVYFYGAGCSRPEMKEKIKNALESQIYMSSAEVEHDMLGAARALLGEQSGVACILGTGSNACLYTNNTISFQLPSFGYLWGDQGSGSYIGKRWVHKYFNKQMPDSIRKRFEEAGYDTEHILTQTYSSNTPNRFLASLVPVIYKMLNEQWVRDFVKNCFADFLDLIIREIPDIQRYPVGFCGSIAHYFSDILIPLVHEKKLSLHKILQDPVPGLIAYHCHVKK